jgi:hypothetical protein
VADGIDATEHGPQPAGLDAAGDRTATKAGREQLLATDHAVLPVGDLGNRAVALLGAFDTHVVYKAPDAADSPPPGGQ